VNYVVVVEVGVDGRIFLYLGRRYLKPARGRKKSKQPRMWSWTDAYSARDAHVFDSLEEALKQAGRVSRKSTFRPARHGQVWLFDHLNCQTIKKLWPSDDVVSVIGLLALDEANVEGR